MIDPFIAAPPNPGFVPPPLELIKAFNLALTPYKPAGIALVNLSGGTGAPQYLGLLPQDTDEKRIFSLAKIAVLFAAFRLRERVRMAGKALQVQGPDQIWPEIEKAWFPIVSKKTAGGRADFPQLKRIFTATGTPGSWNIDFDGTASHTTWKGVMGMETTRFNPRTQRNDIIVDASLSTLQHSNFLDRLKLSASASDNGASAMCIGDIGFQYINGALQAEGLQDSSSFKGLWLSGDFNKTKSFGLNPFPLAGDPDGITGGGTALAVATYFTLLAQGKLAQGTAGETTASQEILDILDGSHGTQSFFGDALKTAAPRRLVMSLTRKIGIGASVSEGAIIERPGGRKYVAVGLDAANADVLDDVVVAMDNCVMNNPSMPGVPLLKP